MSIVIGAFLGILLATGLLVRLLWLLHRDAPPPPLDQPPDPEEKVRQQFARRRSDQMREAIKKARERNAPNSHYW